MGSILETYDSDKLIPLLGFGAILPGMSQASHCFALNGNIFNPEVIGISGVSGAYNKCLQHIKLNGPTYFAPIIRCVGEMANYSLLQGK